RSPPHRPAVSAQLPLRPACPLSSVRPPLHSLSCSPRNVTIASLQGKKAGPSKSSAPLGSGRSSVLVEQRLDQLCKARARPVQPALHRAQIHARDLRDLPVALALQLAQAGHQLVMLRTLRTRLIHALLTVTLPVLIVRPRTP